MPTLSYAVSFSSKITEILDVEMSCIVSSLKVIISAFNAKFPDVKG